jgi:hypothetical protein
MHGMVCMIKDNVNEKRERRVITVNRVCYVRNRQTVSAQDVRYLHPDGGQTTTRTTIEIREFRVPVLFYQESCAFKIIALRHFLLSFYLSLTTTNYKVSRPLHEHLNDHRASSEGGTSTPTQGTVDTNVWYCRRQFGPYIAATRQPAVDCHVE